MSVIAIVSPGYPEHPGGVTAHTRRLHEHWTGEGHRVLVLGRTQQTTAEAIVRDWLAQGVTAILIEYVPFLYGRRGLSRFPGRLARAARVEGMRTTVFVHEPWVPPTRVPWLVLSPLQRWQLRRLVRICNTAVTPVPAWAKLIGDRTEIVYVGSTIGEFAPARDLKAKVSLPAPVVFSPFASGLRWDWMVAAIGAIKALPPVIIIGASADAVRQDGRIRGWDAAWDCYGYLPPEEVLELLARAPLVLAPFKDGITARRTSAMAALSTGARLASSVGHLYDPLFTTSPVAVAATGREFAQLASDAWRAADTTDDRIARLAWYREHLDTRMLDRRLLGTVTRQET